MVGLLRFIGNALLAALWLPTLAFGVVHPHGAAQATGRADDAGANRLASLRRAPPSLGSPFLPARSALDAQHPPGVPKTGSTEGDPKAPVMPPRPLLERGSAPSDSDEASIVGWRFRLRVVAQPRAP